MNKKLLNAIEKAKQNLIIVEGKKDKHSLSCLGFEDIFMIHETGKSIQEKIEKVIEIQEQNPKQKICILTDFDKKGKQLYLLLKSKLQELGVRMDNTLRGALLKEKISHIEGLSSFIKNKKNFKIQKN